MKISLDTETEEIEELRHTLAILEDAIKRREHPDYYEEETEKEEVKAEKTETPELAPKESEQSSFEEVPEKPLSTPAYPRFNSPSNLNSSAPTSNLSKPSFSSPALSSPPPVKPVPKPQNVDMSALTMSNFGERKESRNMKNLSGSSSFSTSSSPPSKPISSSSSNYTSVPRPAQDSKFLVKTIIFDLKNRNPGRPIQMQDIVFKAREKNIKEEETRNLVSQLQREGSI